MSLPARGLRRGRRLQRRCRPGGRRAAGLRGDRALHPRRGAVARSHVPLRARGARVSTRCRATGAAGRTSGPVATAKDSRRPSSRASPGATRGLAVGTRLRASHPAERCRTGPQGRRGGRPCRAAPGGAIIVGLPPPPRATSRGRLARRRQLPAPEIAKSRQERHVTTDAALDRVQHSRPGQDARGAPGAHRRADEADVRSLHQRRSGRAARPHDHGRAGADRRRLLRRARVRVHRRRVVHERRQGADRPPRRRASGQRHARDAHHRAAAGRPGGDHSWRGDDPRGVRRLPGPRRLHAGLGRRGQDEHRGQAAQDRRRRVHGRRLGLPQRRRPACSATPSPCSSSRTIGPSTRTCSPRSASRSCRRSSRGRSAGSRPWCTRWSRSTRASPASSASGRPST